MNKRILLVLSLLLTPALSFAKDLRVVATTPELVDITKRVGGDHVKVDGLAYGTEDIHTVVMRPSFVTKLNKAQAVVYLGLSVEHAFLPGLLDVAKNPDMRMDPVTQGCTGPGCIDCSVSLRVLEKPENLSRAEGEIHPQGNPHYNLNPENGVLIARNIEMGLSRIDAEHAADYAKNLKSYLNELQPQISRLKKISAPLKGVKAVSYHKDVAYLAEFTGLDFIDTLELKPGVSPTPTHLAALVKEMRDQKVKLIVREQQYDAKNVEWLANQTGASVAVIGTMANSLPGTETFIKLSEHNIQALLIALSKENKSL